MNDFTSRPGAESGVGGRGGEGSGGEGVLQFSSGSGVIVWVSAQFRKTASGEAL